MNIKKNIWTDGKGRQFEVIKIDNDPEDSWVDYVNVETGQEYSCRLEAFEARFSPLAA